MAISRLQAQASNPIDLEVDNGETFLTEAKNPLNGVETGTNLNVESQ